MLKNSGSSKRRSEGKGAICKSKMSRRIIKVPYVLTDYGELLRQVGGGGEQDGRGRRRKRGKQKVMMVKNKMGGGEGE